MAESYPIVAATLQVEGDDPEYALYCAAYGIEMQFDDEWRVNVILLAPYDFMFAVTDRTAVTSFDNVAAGAADIPGSLESGFLTSNLRDATNNWSLVGDPRRSESDDQIRAKLRAALDADCRVLLCITTPLESSLTSRMRDISHAELKRVFIVLVGFELGADFIAISHSVQDFVQANIEGSQAVRILIGGEIAPKAAIQLGGTPGVSGIVLLSEADSDFCEILEVVAAVGSAS